MARCRQHLLYALVVFLGLWVSGGAADSLAACNFPAIYVFGSSTSDTGIYSALFRKLELPYGETFFHKPAGRACDGRLVIDFFAEMLKMPYVNPALDISGSDYRHGANFAIGGATVLRQNQTLLGVKPTSLDTQIVNFNDFKQKTADLYAKVGAEVRSKLPLQEEFSKALYVFEIGSNDISKAFAKNMTADEVRSICPDMVKQVASAIQNIYEKGGRSFWIQNVCPVGCYPILQFDLSYLPPSDFDENRCIKIHNEVTKEYNQMLKERIIKLRTELPEAAITYVDTYAAIYELISNAKKEGFEDPMNICCGIHNKEVQVFCSERKPIANGTVLFGGSCKNPETTIGWDGIHRTESANRWVMNRIADGSLSEPPVGITQACHRQP